MIKKRNLIFPVLLAAFLLLAGCDKNNGTVTTDSSTESGDDTMTEEIKLPYSETEINISIDFAARDYTRTPYLKKFDMFTATWAWCNDFTSTPKMDESNLNRIKDIAELLPETMRTDLFMGYYGVGRNIGSSASLSGKTDEEYTMVKELVERLAASNINTEFIYFASPVYTGGGLQNDAWKSVKDLDKWNELCYNMANYFKENNLSVTRHEIWNEPDYYISDPEKDGVYFMGTWQDYIDVYISGAKGVRDADADALIGGVSAAWMNKISRNGEFKSFLEQSLAADILPDYVSWHFYGDNGGMKMLPEYITGARATLEESDAYDTVQQHLNEINITLNVENASSYSMVRSVLSLYDQLLDATDITRMSWALAFDRNLPGHEVPALISPKTGERTPAYYTMWMYARLPIAPVKVEESTSKVEVMASVGDTRAAFLAYDMALNDTNVTFDLSNLPFETGTVTLYVLDSENPQNRVTSNNPKVLETYKDITLTDMKYTVTVPKNGAVYVEINQSEAEVNAHERISELSERVARTDYWYNGRDDGGAHAWISTNSFVASLGSGRSDASRGTACVVTLDDMKETVLSLDTVVSEGAKKVSEKSMLGVTVAYSVNGEYVKTVYHALNGIDGSAIIPLGTERAYDELVSLGSGNGSYSVDLAANAPEGWDGRIQLGFVVNELDDNQGAEFIVNVG